MSLGKINNVIITPHKLYCQIITLAKWQNGSKLFTFKEILGCKVSIQWLIEKDGITKCKKAKLQNCKWRLFCIL